MQSGSHYFALFFIVALGVTSGNLLSNELTAKYIAYKLKAKTEEMKIQRTAQQVARRQEQALKKAIRELEQKEQKEQKDKKLEKRKNSPFGQKLAKRCTDWTRNHKILNTETTAKEAKRHCNNYEDYLGGL